jgi:hypothetical protein
VGVYGGQTNFWPYAVHPVLHFSSTRSSITSLPGVTILASIAPSRLASSTRNWN